MKNNKIIKMGFFPGGNDNKQTANLKILEQSMHKRTPTVRSENECKTQQSLKLCSALKYKVHVDINTSSILD